MVDKESDWFWDRLVPYIYKVHMYNCKNKEYTLHPISCNDNTFAVKVVFFVVV